MNRDTEDTNNLTVNTGDYILSGLIQIISGTIGALVGFGPFQTARLGKYLYDNKGLVFSLIISPFLIIALVFMSADQTASNIIQTPGGGDTQETNIEGITATVLNVPYFNQWLEPDGTYSPTEPKIPVGNENWDLGNVICGAASSVMVAGYFGKLPYDPNNEHDLKRFAYRDEGLNLPSKCANQNIGGAFGMTAYDTTCNQSGFAGISAYLSRFNLNTNSIGTLTFEKVKTSIDQGRPLIVSIISPIGHISVIKGYTADGRLVMNDPYKNVQGGTSGYSYKGKNALYQVNTGWTVNYVMEISN